MGEKPGIDFSKWSPPDLNDAKKKGKEDVAYKRDAYELGKSSEAYRQAQNQIAKERGEKAFYPTTPENDALIREKSTPILADNLHEEALNDDKLIEEAGKRAKNA